MKTFLYTMGACIATFATFMAAIVVTTRNPIRTDDQFGKQVFISLQNLSFEEYYLLFPTLSELNEVMNDNKFIYGNTLSEAQKDLANTYTNTLIPSLKNSFDRIIQKGQEMGIDWQSIKYVRTEVTTGTAFILFKAGSVTYRLRIERALTLKNEWRTSQFISLETL